VNYSFKTEYCFDKQGSKHNRLQVSGATKKLRFILPSGNREETAGCGQKIITSEYFSPLDLTFKNLSTTCKGENNFVVSDRIRWLYRGADSFEVEIF